MNLKGFISDVLGTESTRELRIDEVVMALNDSSARNHWLREVLREIQQINASIDSDLLQKKTMDLAEKSARRRTLQWVLEQALISKRAVDGVQRHNPITGGFANR
jgi:hypothetical protein